MMKEWEAQMKSRTSCLLVCLLLAHLCSTPLHGQVSAADYLSTKRDLRKWSSDPGAGCPVIRADTQPGANAGLQINNAARSSGSKWGVLIDARGIQGGVISSDLFAGVTAPAGRIVFGPGIFTVTATSKLPPQWEVVCEPSLNGGPSYLLPDTATVFHNTSNNLPTFFVGGPGGTWNFRIEGCAFDGSGAGAHIILSNAALGEIKNNFIRGKQYCLFADGLTYSPVYWMRFLDNVFISAGDNVLWQSESSSTTVEFEGNWFRHDDPGYGGGRGINVVSRTGAGGVNGKINRNQFSGNTDDGIMGLAMNLGSCLGLEISANDFELPKVPNSVAVDAGRCYGLHMSGNTFTQGEGQALGTAIRVGDCHYCTFTAGHFRGAIRYDYTFTGNSIGTYVFGATSSAVAGHPRQGAIWFEDGTSHAWGNIGGPVDIYEGNVHQINLPRGTNGGLYLLRSETPAIYAGVGFTDDNLYVGRAADGQSPTATTFVVQQSDGAAILNNKFAQGTALQTAHKPLRVSSAGWTTVNVPIRPSFSDANYVVNCQAGDHAVARIVTNTKSANQVTIDVYTTSASSTFIDCIFHKY
jgi:hypothetical protein